VLFLCTEKIPGILFTFPSLVACTGQKLFMFMLSHFFSSFFNDASQPITSLRESSIVLFLTTSTKFQPFYLMPIESASAENARSQASTPRPLVCDTISPCNSGQIY
jgi:hypothetical protein